MAINDTGANEEEFNTVKTEVPKETKPTAGYDNFRDTRNVPNLDLNLYDFFGESDLFLGLSPDGNKYVEELKNFTQNLGLGYRFETMKNGIDCILVLHGSGKYGVLLGFAETAPKNPEIPIIAYMEEVNDKCKKQFNCTICNAIVIGPEEYSKAAVLISNIASLFKQQLGEGYQMTLRSFAGYRISVNTANQGAVGDMFRKHYPHAVLPRMDVAAAITLIPPGKTRSEEGRTIAVITGYTDFIGQQSTVFNTRPTKFSPLFHMEMHSQVNDPALFVFLMPAIDMFCRRNGWLKTYSEYGPNDINIGSLIPTERGGTTPWKATCDTERSEFLSDYMTSNPIPVLDVFAGKYQLPLVRYFTGDKENMGVFIRRLAAFFETGADKVPLPVYDKTVTSHVGIITDPVNNRQFDSRMVDFLYMVHKQNSMAGLQAWLNYSTDKLKSLVKYHESRFENRYINFMKVVNSDFISWCTGKFAQNGIRFEYDGEKFDNMYSGGDFTPDIFQNFNFDSFNDIQKTRAGGGYTSYRM